MSSVYADFAIGWRNWCGARGNWQGARELAENWQLADVSKRATRVEFSVCLVLHEAAHFQRIDQARDDADITLRTRRRHAGNGVVWSAACATSLRLPRQS